MSKIETDMARRCRSMAEDLRHGLNEPNIRDIRLMLEDAAKECDRYYNGMVNWKSTAEAKDIAPRVDKESKL